MTWGRNPIRDKKCPSLLKTHLEPPYENYTEKPVVMIIASPTQGKILHCNRYDEVYDEWFDSEVPIGGTKLQRQGVRRNTHACADNI
jgi:hypothetical protein